MKGNKNQEIYCPKRIAILTLIVMVPLFLFGCTSEKDKQIADLTKKVEEQSKQVEALSKKREQDIAKQDMDLQEECSKITSEYIKKTDFSNISHVNYTNHYNKKLNKCFMHLTAGGNGEKYIEGLYDINENKQYGYFVGLDIDNGYIKCIVNNNQCYSKSQWESLAKPYMEE